MIYENFLSLDSKKHDRIIKSLVGMDRARFDKLADAFAAASQAAHQERLEKGEIKRIPSGGPTGRLDTPGKQLFFVLFYLKTYPTFDALGFFFGFSSGHAHDHLERLLPVLQGSLSALGVLPARTPGTPGEFAQLIERYGDIAIDGLECPCVRPQEKALREARYSGKKNAARSRRSPSPPSTGKSSSCSASLPEASMITRS